MKRTIKILVFLLALLMLASCSQNDIQPQPNVEDEVEDGQIGEGEEEITTQIVVVGSGLSGSSTAISALQNGADVILVEKAGIYGPSFLSSRGNLMNAMVEENKEAHIIDSDDTLEKAFERWQTYSAFGNNKGLDEVDSDRVKEILVESAYSIQWLESLGIDMEPSFTFEQRGEDIAKVVKQGDEMEGLTLMKVLEETFDELAGVKLLSTTATKLIEEDGKVIGIKAESKDKQYTIYADAVVLATGGFGGDAEKIQKYLPEVANLGYQFTGNTLNTGDAIEMAEELDVQTYDTNWIVTAPGVILPTKELTEKDRDFTKINSFSPFEQNLLATHILVDNKGNRFTNEAGMGVVIAADMIDFAQDGAYLVFDSSNEEITSLLEKYVDAKNIYKTDSFDKLEKFPELANTMTEYSEFVANKEDTSFNKNSQFLIEYGEGPYYLISVVPDFVATMGGIVSNENNQVLNNANQPITGLYAVGELTHRFMYNRGHFANASNSASVSMGRILGENLAVNLNK